jgi:hypothetical protein
VCIAFYHFADKHGHVPDNIFESHGFPVDSDKNVKPVRSPAGISQDCLQRANNISHEEQKERKDRTVRKEKKKVAEE